MSGYLMQYISEQMGIPEKRASMIFESLQNHVKKEGGSPLAAIPKVFTECEINGSSESLLLSYYALDFATKKIEEERAFTKKDLDLKKGKEKISQSFDINDKRADQIITAIRKNIDKYSKREPDEDGMSLYRMRMFGYPGEITSRATVQVDKIRVIEGSITDLQPTSIKELVFIAYIAGLEVGQKIVQNR